MKRIKSVFYKVFALVMFVSGASFFSGCNKVSGENENPETPSGEKDTRLSISISNAVSTATTITFSGVGVRGADVPEDAEIGFEYSQSRIFTEKSTISQPVNLSSNGSWTYVLEKLPVSTTFYYRTYTILDGKKVSATNSSSVTTQGIEITFGNPIHHDSDNSYEITGTVNDVPEGIKFTLLYSTTNTFENAKQAEIVLSGKSFSARLYDLKPGTTYYKVSYVMGDYSGSSEIENFRINALGARINVVRAYSLNGNLVLILDINHADGYTLGYDVAYDNEFVNKVPVDMPAVPGPSVAPSAEDGVNYRLDVNVRRPSTTYYYRTYVTAVGGTPQYSETGSITFEDLTLGVSAQSITSTTVDLTVNFVNTLSFYWNFTGIDFRIVYSESSDPVAGQSGVVEKVLVGKDDFNGLTFEPVHLDNLKASTKYYCRAYYIIDGKSVYSNQMNFTTTKAE